ncbi:hypothetical protein B4902_08235 [Yersinia frederiksenii]|uniref:hypothetical protein n=1 Tax=Yersinia frederiksenii TaxID=29484 RepID=UPI000B4924FD|nr:hypothetical protein [Yersinia frederiksenii]OWF73262.1 hypothetical protein B4902_08235 [Yersinia frederiksenii]
MFFPNMFKSVPDTARVTSLNDSVVPPPPVTYEALTEIRDTLNTAIDQELFPNIGLGYVDGVFEQEFPDEVVIHPVTQQDS